MKPTTPAGKDENEDSSGETDTGIHAWVCREIT